DEVREPKPSRRRNRSGRSMCVGRNVAAATAPEMSTPMTYKREAIGNEENLRSSLPVGSSIGVASRPNDWLAVLAAVRSPHDRFVAARAPDHGLGIVGAPYDRFGIAG